MVESGGGNLLESGRGKVWATEAGMSRAGEYLCPVLREEVEERKSSPACCATCAWLRCPWGVLLLVWGEPEPSEPKPGSWACFETGQVHLGSPAEAGSAREVPHENLWGAMCSLCTSGQIPSGCSSGKEALPFDLFGVPGFRHSRKQFCASVPSCSLQVFFWRWKHLL